MTMTTERTRLTQAIANIDSLPAMPAIALKLMSLRLDTDEGEIQLLNLIGQDPQISAKLISLANSPVMSMSVKVSNITDAALRLGLTRVKSVSLGIAAMSNFTQPPGPQNFAPQDLWLHSLTIAIAMHTLSLEMPAAIRPPQDHIYLAGLLHDIGYMAIQHIDAVASNDLHHQLRLQPKRPVVDIEMQILGVSHCYIGAQLARQWNLPEEIITVLANHHIPYIDDMSAGHPLVRLLNVSEKLLPNFGITEYCGTEISDAEWQELGINPEKAEELRDSINELAIQAAQIADVF
ncbi:MAG: HDOD domain-containing protein [Gallionella sp.]|jgi:putative nucleotidyltransferase with HDIG domain